ncbi:MAG: alpha/beta hydrolase, partial [bacterium]|nr:alpha/beta hydrolase [bacterium]
MRKKSLLLVIIILIFTIYCQDNNETLTATDGFIELDNGAKLYYQEIGEGMPVVMIHGGFLTHKNWDPQFEVFAKQGIRAIRYDARGHGKTLNVPGDFNHTEDLKLLLDQLDIDKAVIMGLSMGGYVCSDFALTYPERVKGLVLVSPGMTGFDFSTAEYMEEYFKQSGEAYESGDTNRIIESFMRGWTDGPFRTPDQTPADVREKSRLMCLETANNSPDVEAREVRPEPAAIDRLSDIKAPTLGILATLDMPVIAAIIAKYEEDIPDFRKVVIEDAAHAVNMEKPEEFNRAVLGFLKEL